MKIDELLDFTRRRIIAMRKDSGLSQQTLAERAGLSVDSVGKLERGEQLVSLKTLNKLCQALGIPLPVFFGAETDTSPDDAQKTILGLCLYLSDKDPKHIRLANEMVRQLITRLEADQNSGPAS
ncbi:MAG TPA: XRE family transcriptional regulator [Candidatus Handelsmanbacteria bacterium]|nr:XRE family transcriptional regulator [Candidatus Handelsmanbacteria bacterium]